MLLESHYPEHWPRERWEVDARLMAEAGDRVRMGRVCLASHGA